MSKDLEALRTACNAKGISCRGKKGGYLHRRTLISKIQHGGVRPRGPNPFAEFANRHRMLLTSFLVKGDPDEIINIADSTIRREIKAFPEIKRKDWKIKMEGAHAIDGIYPYVLNVWIENHPELTYNILRPIVDNVRNALAHLIIP